MSCLDHALNANAQRSASIAWISNANYEPAIVSDLSFSHRVYTTVWMMYPEHLINIKSPSFIFFSGNSLASFDFLGFIVCCKYNNLHPAWTRIIWVSCRAMFSFIYFYFALLFSYYYLLFFSPIPMCTECLHFRSNRTLLINQYSLVLFWVII